MRKEQALAFLLTLLSSTLILGCGDGLPARTPVEGIVLYEDGSPVVNAAVAFHPQDGLQAKDAMGITNQDGKFVMYTFQDKNNPDGAPIGSHIVTISGMKETLPPKNRFGEIDETQPGKVTWFVNPKYAISKTSPFTINVTPGIKPIKFEVTK